MKFSDVNETVTAKESVNLRDIPSQGNDSTIKATLNNGDTAARTGVSDSGWSRSEYNGQTYYAISKLPHNRYELCSSGTGRKWQRRRTEDKVQRIVMILSLQR